MDIVNNIVSQLTLTEKASICSGADNWRTRAIPRLNIPEIMMIDGPHGLRRENPGQNNGAFTSSIPATCFPCGSTLACSWDKSLLARLGNVIAQECRAQGASVILGPAVNIQRSPLCGRNFEYFSEDPYLSSQLAASFINGVQSRGIGTAIKHFAANNKETDRMTTETIIDERTLREIYLASFENAIKTAKPWMVMCAYNKLNGTFCSENKRLLTGILRNEWGFDGVVVSDWGAVNERDDGILAGLDLEMPSSGNYGTQKILAAVENGKLPEKVLDKTAERIIRLVLKAHENAGVSVSDFHLPETMALKDHKFSRSIAGQCMVLLKNSGMLPLKKTGKLAVIGAFAKKPRFEGGGSSRVNPTTIDIPLEEIKKSAPDLEVVYCEGYKSDNDEPCITLTEQAVSEAQDADAAVIFAGLPDSYESEGYDRTHMRMPQSHNELISAVAKVQKNTAVVLFCGSPVEMPWIDDVAAVIYGGLCGQACGGAAADILFGDVNPSGKLAETFPKRLCDTPSYLNFPGEKPNYVEYREGVFVGYRYYQKKNIKPLFPFGFGLSYTSFSYTKIEADRDEINDNETINVKVTVTNTGNCSGEEIVQLYVHPTVCPVIRPEKELRGFEKIFLDAGERTTVKFSLSKRDFAYFDTSIHDWNAQGKFEVCAGGCCDDTPLKVPVTVHSTIKKKTYYTRQSHIADVLKNPEGAKIMTDLFEHTGTKSGDIPDWILGMPLRSLIMSGVSSQVIDRIVEKLNNSRPTDNLKSNL
jgi:beta-glucosidase